MTKKREPCTVGTRRKVSFTHVSSVPKRKGMKCIKTFPKDEVVGIISFSKKLIIATKHGVYMYPKPEKGK